MYNVTTCVSAASLISNVVLLTVGLDLLGTLPAVQGWNKHHIYTSTRAGINNYTQLIIVDM